MDETLKKLTEETKAKIAELLSGAEFKHLIESTKAAADSGTFEVIISTADIDRQGESVDQAGWELENYKANPIVLWAHDYYCLPIGICDELVVRSGQLIAKGRFASEEANPFAQQVRRLYDMGIIRTTSVGFIAKEMQGHIITKAELLEFSFVPVPANPYALSLSQAKGFDLNMLVMKGLKIEVKADPAVGDTCTLPDDAGEGTMQDDGNGTLVCTPKAAKQEEAPADTEPAAPVEPVEPAAPEETEEAKALKELNDARSFYADAIVGREKNAQQIGAVLAQLQNVIDNALVNASRIIIDVINTEYGQSAEGKTAISDVLKSFNLDAIQTSTADFLKKLGISEGEEQRDGAAPNERSEDKVFNASLKTLNEFMAAQQILKSVATAAQSALESINQKMRSARKGSR